MLNLTDDLIVVAEYTHSVLAEVGAQVGHQARGCHSRVIGDCGSPAVGKVYFDSR